MPASSLPRKQQSCFSTMEGQYSQRSGRSLNSACSRSPFSASQSCHNTTGAARLSACFLLSPQHLLLKNQGHQGLPAMALNQKTVIHVCPLVQLAALGHLFTPLGCSAVTVSLSLVLRRVHRAGAPHRTEFGRRWQEIKNPKQFSTNKQTLK